MPNIQGKDANNATIFIHSTRAGTDLDPHSSNEDTIDRLGPVGETAPASDTASSGLNGRLQRIAQRLTSLISGIGATNDAAATSDTGTFSLISLVKRLLSRLGATRLYVATTIATSGDNTVISAPAAGVRIVITGLRIQNNTSTTTTLLLKDGAATTVSRLRAVSDGSGLSENYGLGDEIRLTAATAFVINLSGANSHGVSVRYWLENASTGLPI